MKSIADLDKEVLELTIAHQSACVATEQARAEETKALNLLNAAQREFDEAIEAKRGAARSETDWGHKPDRKR